MAQSAYFGSNFGIIKAATALGSANGINIPLVTPINLGLNFGGISGHIIMVTTATVGSRRPGIKLLDPNSNVLMESYDAQTAPAASNPGFAIMFGPGSLATDLTAFFSGVVIPWPPIPVGPGFSLQVLDAAHIDNADTVAVNLILGPAF